MNSDGVAAPMYSTHQATIRQLANKTTGKRQQEQAATSTIDTNNE